MIVRLYNAAQQSPGKLNFSGKFKLVTLTWPLGASERANEWAVGWAGG